MLTNQQIECIENLVVGTMTVAEVANKVGCTSRVIYKWKNNGEFKAELDKRSLEFKSGIIQEAQDLLTSKLGVAISNIVDIANDKNTSDKVRLDANQYLVNRILGNTTTKIEQSIDNNKDDNSVNIDALIDDIIDNEDNVIELDNLAK
ncbi:MAG: hypothetical protein E7F83_16220 [Clostridium sp.]|uniref:phBC6A51 family helix-turn-helix protein n=1 Tax=Clostridium sp. TaxID=1506 RepID=UPI0029114033|nr:hypothetical protein [Clostridium sp.]MDU3548952.1 hypothetical protein [Clostridium sp.]MDU7243360.1 hypothetical protein [Clostridium sp.]